MSTLRHRTMTLRLGFCFFFHQPLGENAARAGRIGYRGFLGVLQNHPRMKFNLMLSGTLLGALGWFDPALVETVRRGVESGTFRMLGSLYAQSMPLALDEMDCIATTSGNTSGRSRPPFGARNGQDPPVWRRSWFDADTAFCRWRMGSCAGPAPTARPYSGCRRTGET
jgi:hypothetical protein